VEEFDVAFSLLSGDEPIASAIEACLPAGVECFLYSTKQREVMIARDGVEAFPDVFRKAKVCVILYRTQWGQTPWTRLEQRTIADRFMEDGSAFLTLVRLDGSEPPSWFPRADFWIHYQQEGPEATASYISGRIQHSRSGAIGTRVTARTADRRPMPTARYQPLSAHSVEQFIPMEPMICDGCTAGVQFRPLVRISLPADERWPATTEQFCPRCARDRQIGVMIPPGMTKDEVYAAQNPTFGDHLKHILAHAVLPALSADPELKAMGVERVGAMTYGHGIALLVSRPSRKDVSAEIPVRQLEAERFQSDAAIVAYMKRRVLDALRGAAQEE
jgi:hypothetical protein